MSLGKLWTAAKLPWLWLKQTAMEWSSAVLVTTVSIHTCACWKVHSYMTGPPKGLLPCMNLGIKMALFSYHGPNIRTPKTCNQRQWYQGSAQVLEHAGVIRWRVAWLQEESLQHLFCDSIWLLESWPRWILDLHHTVNTQPSLALNPLLTHSNYFLGYKVISVFYSLNITRQRFLT